MQPSYDIRRFKDIFEKKYTYLNGFMRSVSRLKDKIALYDPLTERSWTYDALNKEANRLAHALKAGGVQHGDVLMSLLFNSPEFVFFYLAAHKLGCVYAPANYRLAGGEIALLIEAHQPKVLIYDAEFTANVEKTLHHSLHKPDIVLVSGSAKEVEVPAGVQLYSAYIQGHSEDNPELDFTPCIYDETVRFFTSGTTNLPKGVPINSLNEVLTAHDILIQFPVNEEDVTMNLTPWFHRGGLHSGGPTPLFYCGGTVVSLREFSPRLTLRYVERFRITFLIGVPTIVDMLCRMQKTLQADLSSLKGLILNGSPLDRAACEKYSKELNVRLFNGYGTTETYCNTFLRPLDLPDKAGSAGHACQDDDVRVVRISTNKHATPDDLVPKDGKAVGEVIIQAPGKSTYTYFGNASLTAEKFVDGWMYTGDLATWDQHSYITILGRKDDMFVSAGENIYPTQIEAILNEHPEVEESLIIGLPDAKRGTIVCALIKKSPDSKLSERDLKQYCLQSVMLSSYKRPRKYIFVDALPHTAAGKLIHKLSPELQKLIETS